MKNQKLCDIKTMWQFYCNSPDAVPAIKKEEKKLIYQQTELENNLAEQQFKLHQLCEQIASVKRDAPIQIAKLALTNKTDAYEFASQLNELETEKDFAQLALSLTQPALATPRAQYLFLLSKYKDDLIQWVALQRCKDVLAVGEVMPIEVSTMWHLLAVRFHKMPDGININHHLPILPISWAIENTDSYRASMAWLWAQLASKQFKWKPRAKKSKEYWLVITNEVDELPPVPKQQNAPKPIQWVN
jgi:hypothetical protein